MSVGSSINLRVGWLVCEKTIPQNEGYEGWLEQGRLPRMRIGPTNTASSSKMSLSHDANSFREETAPPLDGGRVNGSFVLCGEGVLWLPQLTCYMSH